MTYINHPYLKVLQDTLKVHKTLLECLEKRMTLIHIDYATKNEYEKNEIEITKIRTQGEIDAIKKVIKAREEYFEKYMQKFIIDLEDCNNNYENVLTKAKKISITDEELKHFLSLVNWKNVDENTEVKIKFYQKSR